MTGWVIILLYTYNGSLISENKNNFYMHLKFDKQYCFTKMIYFALSLTLMHEYACVTFNLHQALHIIWF